MKFSDFDNDREKLKVMTMEYSIERDGHRLPEPIVQLFCRDRHGERRYLEVEGFYPFFYISEAEFHDKQDELLNEGAIRSIEAREILVDKEHSMNTTITNVDDAPATTLHGDNLVKVYTVEPKHVKELRDFFDETWEADVFFTNRFLIETGIKRGLTAPPATERVAVEDIDATEELPEIAPRVVTIDIEVWSGGSFPDVEEAKNPITSYTLHDSYDDSYIAAILQPDSRLFGDDVWSGEPEWELPDGVSDDQIEIVVFDDEAEMLAAANKWITEKDPDLLTGWNSSRNDIGNGFDYPYWINRCENINEWTFAELSPLNQTFTTNSGTPVVKGREMFDMLQAYKKTQIHEKKSYALGYIAQDELGYGKEDIDSLDDGWKYNPAEFMKYNIRDVSAVVEIEDSKGVLDMYDHIRHVTGTSYSECADSNIGIIDVLFLRQAKDKGFALPTSTKPERGWYYGGKVFNPIPGKHKNVVYPDLASLYPYLMWSLNVSPETVFDTLEEARAAGYDEDDLYRASVDRREDDVKRDSDPERSDIYYTKPEVKEGFVREVIDDLVSMKYEYKKPQYSSEKYGAVKRIVNSCFTPDTDVLTPDGVKKITEIGVGDTVYSWNKETGVMEEKPVTETIEKPDYDGELVHIQNRNIDLKVTPDHRMLVKRTRYSDEWETVDAGQLNEYTQYETPNRWTYEHADGIETVDLAEFVDDSFEVTDETITAGENHTTFDRFVDGDAFIELLGWYITEGSVYVSSDDEARGDALTISQYKSVNGYSYDRIIETVEQLGVYASQAEGAIAICGSLYSHIATSLCGSSSENKHIPDFIFEQASGRQKEMLFDVLMLGDGDKNRNRYSTQSTQLRDDVIQLCWQLGKKPQYRYDDSGEFNTGVWRVHFTNDDTGNKSKQSFRMHRDGDTETAENGVYCIQVKENHTLVAGRNGKFTNIWNCYGVFGDSASYGKGFRLFDWRLAETITLAGQSVVTYTSDEFEKHLQENGYPDAKRVGGDSVPANEPTLVNRGSGPEIISIEDVCVGDSVWSHDGWTTVKDVIRKPNRKKLHTVATKSGITHVTEDHSLVRDTMEEVPPKEVSEGDALLHKDIASVDTDELDFHEKRAWLLGLFAAEGSCGIYECESGSKASWAINNSERVVLEEAQEIMSSVFGIQTKIDDVMESSNTMKLRLYGNVDNASTVLGFREMLYNGTEKRVPKEILQSSNTAKRAFLAGYHTGDGHIAYDSKEFDEMWTKHKHLGAGIVFLLRQLGHKVTLSVRTRQKSEYYRIRAVGFHRGSAEEVRTIEEFEYDGEYVYDLETESHHFQSGIGSMIVHNTDSVMTKIPSLDVSPEEIQEDFEKIESGEEPELPLFKAAQYVNDSYDQFMHEEFWIDDPSMHKMEVEIESYADAIFFLRDFKSNDPNKGVKKRYSQLVTWDEGTIISNPSAETKGFELVRSDTANITTRVQEHVLELLLKQDEPKDAIREYLIDEWEQSTSGEVDLSDIGIPSAISKPLDEYGGPNKNGNYTTPQPHIRGAKYANAHVSGESISSGDKPLFFYTDRVGYQYPDVYVYEEDWSREELMTLQSDTVRELGRDMDAIAVNDVRNLPDEIHVDYEKMSKKTLRRPIEPIVKTMGWAFDDMTTESAQTGLAQFM